LRSSNKGSNLGVVKKPQVLTNSAGTDANSYVETYNLWLDTMLSQETRVSSEAETIERTALVFRTGWTPANHKSTFTNW